MAESEKLNRKLLFAAIAASAGAGFVPGYHTSVLNIPGQIIRNWLNETHKTRSGSYMDLPTQNSICGLISSMVNAGAILGGLLVGVHIRKFGPRKCLLLNNILVLISAILISIAKPAKAIETFIIGRFVVGINIGLNCGACSTYLSEIAPVRLRGAVSSSYQLAVSNAILLAQIVGLPVILGTYRRWPYLFILPIFIGAFQVATLSLCPESPRFLISIEKEEEAKKALQFLRMSDDVTEDFNLIKSEDANVRSLPKVSLKDVCKTRQMKIPLLIALAVHVAQQSSGITAITLYSTHTFLTIGYSGNASKYFTTIIGVIMIIMTIVSLFLVEMAGRKTLLLTGFGGMAVILIMFSISMPFAGPHNEPLAWLCFALLFLSVIFYAIGPGPIPWFFVTEIFNQSARPRAVALSVAVNGLANVVVTFIYPSLESGIGSYTFLIFGLLDLIYFLVFGNFYQKQKIEP